MMWDFNPAEPQVLPKRKIRRRRKMEIRKRRKMEIRKRRKMEIKRRKIVRIRCRPQELPLRVCSVFWRNQCS